MCLLKFKMNPFMLISSLVTSYIFIVEGQSSCTTPSSDVGSCVSLFDCNELLSIVKKPDKSQKDIDKLRSFTCGFEGNTPRVCCPTQNQTKFQSLLPERNPNFNPDLIKDCDGKPGVSPPDPYSGCCGKQVAEDDHIISGDIAKIDEFPWLVIIEGSENNTTKFLCGGALISDRYVLTAAFCVTEIDIYPPSNIRLGEYDTSNEIDQMDCVGFVGGSDCSDAGVVIPIEKIIPHPDYNPYDENRKHDIALLRMSKSAPYSDFIRPICLPISDTTLSPPSRRELFAAGWGISTYRPSNLKLYAELPLVSHSECQAISDVKGHELDLWQGQICAGGGKDERTDSCRVDSGGPLMWRKRDRKGLFEVVGIASYGPSLCGVENFPLVFTKVYEYNSWIRQTITS
ncbi:phenoloxidase-activating enzyme-like [Hyposmocoma kahamanoa]|uniref:phenoloxidase-activating enzyme-like n=1 Tax=Hyposmocoma kahamanoa TaxID=1477025 RepID=UPI000E6D7456|nr:phenoloxidase-activating enzyme-like [Hyposmocoma kahamanoa]